MVRCETRPGRRKPEWPSPPVFSSLETWSSAQQMKRGDCLWQQEWGLPVDLQPSWSIKKILNSQIKIAKSVLNCFDISGGIPDYPSVINPSSDGCCTWAKYICQNHCETIQKHLPLYTKCGLHILVYVFFYFVHGTLGDFWSVHYTKISFAWWCQRTFANLFCKWFMENDSF